jgi:hypothetical protein
VQPQRALRLSTVLPEDTFFLIGHAEIGCSMCRRYDRLSSHARPQEPEQVPHIEDRRRRFRKLKTFFLVRLDPTGEHVVAPHADRSA